MHSRSTIRNGANLIGVPGRRLKACSTSLWKKNFLSWMSGEFAITQSEPGLLGHDPELILAIGAKSIKDARKNMEFIEKKIRRRTPLRIKTVDYKGFESTTWK